MARGHPNSRTSGNPRPYDPKTTDFFAADAAAKGIDTRRCPWGSGSVALVGRHQYRLYSLLDIAHNPSELIRQRARSRARRFRPPVDQVQVFAIRAPFP
jgi:hypothetical protein